MLARDAALEAIHGDGSGPVTGSRPDEGAQVASASRWIAPESMAAKPDLCEQDRRETLDRILLVVAPAPVVNQ